MRYALLPLTVLSPVLAGVHELWWNITYVENVNPDGLFSRRAIGVNGSWPPPPIEVNAADSIVLHALNSLDQPTTLHHHGMFFNSTSWMDGAQGVSQCGIPPSQSFTYVVPVNASGQWGTYWVHAHAQGQYVDGLRAPLLIHPVVEANATATSATNFSSNTTAASNGEVYTYDEEFTVVLSDWYHQEHSVLMEQFLSISNPGGAEPIPDAGLIYFYQNGAYLGPISGTQSLGASSHIGFNENATIPFTPGKKYRLRIVNTSAFAAFYFWIDGHDMKVIEVDGTDTQEYATDNIMISVAQRYSVLVEARNDTSANWAIHANMDSTMFDFVPDNLEYNVTSSITYSSSAPLTNLGDSYDYHDVDDLSIVPIPVIPQLPPATTNVMLEFNFDTLTDGKNHALVNGTTYNSPNVPAIMSTLTLGDNATVANAYGPLSFVVNHLDIVDITIMNADTGKHPFHLHGHKMQLVGRAIDYTSDNSTLNPPIAEGQANPMRSSITLRLVADNPGAWILHCHIEWHLEVGLAVQFIEAPLEAQNRASTFPKVLTDQCAALGYPTSGNAAGHASTTDLSGLKLGPYVQKNYWLPKGIWAMTGCVLTAVLGMLSVVWYAMGGHVTEEEVEEETRKKMNEKESKRAAAKRLFGLGKN